MSSDSNDLVPKRVSIKLLSSKALKRKAAEAVVYFWQTRLRQADKQSREGRKDQGARSAVTGGAQMDGFVSLISDIACSSGAMDATIYRKKKIELPGYFRPTKEWDLLVVSKNRLVAVIEAKSQIGPSFGNNFNNRTEEALGSAVDLWTAYREGAFSPSAQPWLGYLFLLEDCPASRKPVSAREPHFKVFPEFRNASYAKRYEVFLLKLVRERHYNSACFLVSNAEDGLAGKYAEPTAELSFEKFARSLQAQIASNLE